MTLSSPATAWYYTLQLLTVGLYIYLSRPFSLKKFSVLRHIIFGSVMRECDGLLSEVWIDTVECSEELISEVQLNKYETAPNFIQLTQNLT